MKIMYDGELRIRCGILDKGSEVQYFDVTWMPDNVYRGIDNPCNYESVMKMINDIYPDSIVFDPEGISGLTLAQFLYDTHSNYDSSVRKIQRGGEFVEKFVSYEIILHLKQKFKENLD